MKEVNEFQLADALFYIFAHVDELTGMCHFQFKLKKQIRSCKQLKHVMQDRFSAVSDKNWHVNIMKFGFNMKW